MAKESEYQKVQYQLVEQNIKIQKSVSAGATEYFTVDVPENAKVFLKGYGYSYYPSTSSKLRAGNTAFPSRTDQEGSPSIPMIYGNPIQALPSHPITLKITNGDSAAHTYDVVFYILTSRIIEVSSTGGEIVLATSTSSGGVSGAVAIYDSTIATAVDVTTAGGKNNLNTQAQITDGTTVVDVAVEGSASKTKGLQLMADDGTNAINIQADASGNLKTVKGVTAHTPAHSVVTVGSASTSVLAANANRKSALFVNDSDETIYLSVDGTAATLNDGIRLNANGGSYSMNSDEANLTVLIVYAICTSGSKNLLVTEFT